MREITCCPARAEETLPGGAARCPVLTPCLSLRLQPGLVQPWQESELHCECYLCIYRLDLLTEGLTPLPSFFLPPSFLPSPPGVKKKGLGWGNSWVQQLLPWGEAPVMAVRRLLLGVGAAAAADIAPAIPTPASRRRAAAAARLTRLRREGEGIFRVPSRVSKREWESVTRRLWPSLFASSKPACCASRR